MFSLKDIVNGQEVKSTKSFNTDLFKADRETLEQFVNTDYSIIYLISLDNTHGRGEHDNLRETIVCVGHESDFYLVTATKSSYNGEDKVTFVQQELTLSGFNYFTKDEELDEDIYNNYLVSQGYEATVQDIRELGEWLPDYNCTILKFKDEQERIHRLTVSSKTNRLSKITVSGTDKPVQSKETEAQKIASAFEGVIVANN